MPRRALDSGCRIAATDLATGGTCRRRCRLGARETEPPCGLLRPLDETSLTARACSADGPTPGRHGDASVCVRGSCSADAPNGWPAEYRTHR